MFKPTTYLPLICFCFYFSLLSGPVSAETLDKVVAVVNESVITSNELNAEVTLLSRQMAASGMQLPSNLVLKKQVLQHLIDVNIELQLAKQHNMSIDNAELESTISKIASENKITLDQLKQAVEHEGVPWKKYQENMRKEVLLARLHQKAVGQEVRVTAEQVEDYLKSSAGTPDRASTTFQIQDLLIPLPEEPTSDQLQKAKLKANRIIEKMKKQNDFAHLVQEESDSDFVLEENDLGARHLAELPEIFAKTVSTMNPGQVQGPLRTGNGLHIIQLVALGGDTGKHEVLKTHVRHILLKPDANMTSMEARRQANNLYQQIKSGKDFKLLAKQYSLDQVSAVKGGDLGWVNPGELVPEVEKAMNKLPPHQVSKPIQSVFGWHLIEVLERKKVNDTESFKRQQVRKFLQQRKFNEAVQNWQQHMRSTAYIKIMEKDLA